MAAYIAVLNCLYSLCVFYYSVLSCVADVADCPLQRLSATVIKNIIIIIDYYYKIWIVMQQRMYESRINNADELKQRLHDVWHGVQQHIIDLAVSQWRQRLTACVRAHGRHLNICCELV